MIESIDSRAKPARYLAADYAWPTLFLWLVFCVSVPTNVFLFWSGRYSEWVALGVGLVLYNCAFTLWHEAAHGNVSRNKYLNDLVGVSTSVLNLFPAFYRQRHDHLLHHRYLLNEEYDRTVYRARGPIFRLPLLILDEMRTYAPYDQAHGLKVHWKRRADHLTYVLIFLGVLGLILTGGGKALFFCCVLPRLIILPIHVTYVCYLPHVGLPKSQDQGTRILNVGWLKYFIFFHNYHAIHHLWPAIPWYQYEKYFFLNLPVLRDKHVEILVKPWEAPITGPKSRLTGERAASVP